MRRRPRSAAPRRAGRARPPRPGWARCPGAAAGEHPGTGSSAARAARSCRALALVGTTVRGRRGAPPDDAREHDDRDEIREDVPELAGDLTQVVAELPLGWPE